MNSFCRSAAAVFILLVLSSSLQAQDIRPGIELSGGYVSFDLQGNVPIYVVDAQPGLLSYGASVFAEIPLARTLTLRPALRYVRLGDSFTYQRCWPEGSVTACRTSDLYRSEKKYRYVALPVRLRYSPAPVPLYVIGGVSPGYLVSGESTGYYYEGRSRDFNVTSGIDPRWNINVSGGLGTAFSLYGHAMFIETSVTRGLLQLPGFVGDTSFHAREMMLRLGYQW